MYCVLLSSFLDGELRLFGSQACVFEQCKYLLNRKKKCQSEDKLKEAGDPGGDDNGRATG